METFTISLPNKVSLSLGIISKRDELLASARTVAPVTDDATLAINRGIARDLADFRIMVEKTRKEVKAPIIEIGSQIDDLAKSLSNPIQLAESAINGAKIDYDKAEKAKADEAARIARAEAARIIAESKAKNDRLEKELADAKEATRKAEEQAKADREAAEAAKAEVTEVLTGVAAIKQRLAEANQLEQDRKDDDNRKEAERVKTEEIRKQREAADERQRVAADEVRKAMEKSQSKQKGTWDYVEADVDFRQLPDAFINQSTKRRELLAELQLREVAGVTRVWRAKA